MLAHLGGAVLPAGRLRRLSLVLLGTALTAGLVWFRQLRVERLLSESGAAELLSTAGQLQTFGPSWSPAQRLARFVVDGDAAALAQGTVGVLIAIFVAFAAHVALYDRARKLAVDESPTGVLSGSLSARALDVVTRAAPADLRPLLRKDLLAFVRDPGQWGQVILLVGVGVLYAVNASAMGEGLVLLGGAGGAVLTATHVGIVAFIAGGLAARFAFPQVGLEGPAVWITDGAPLSPSRLLVAKWLAALPVTAVFPAILGVAGAVVLDFSVTRAVWTSGVLTIAAVLFAGLGVARGARQPLYDAASLSELAMGPGAISTIVQTTATAGVLAFAALIVEGLRVGAERGFVSPSTAAVGGLVAVIVPVAALWLMVRQAMRAAADALHGRRRDGGVPIVARTTTVDTDE